MIYTPTPIHDIYTHSKSNHTLGRHQPGQSHPWPSQCPACASQCDPYSDHFFKCRSGFQWIHRHNALVSAFARIAREAKADVRKEQLVRNYGVSLQQFTTKKRMDLVVRMPDGAQTFLDVSVTHPCHRDDPGRRENRTNQTSGAALRAAEADKIRKYGDIANQTGFSFISLACETFGRWSPATETFLHKLAKGVRENHYKNDPSMSTGLIVSRWWCVPSIALKRYNAWLVSAKTNPDKKTDTTRPFPADEV
ncbi:unnamed protein product [Vitrella brassicaformis CCMP3155]|uniref:Uncharacterized protein n=1 Tax=Vitrella brassicaformis (strain CCMP3155) TaxID=1169540 RepID=A0A0G4GVK7_VITBC|nr:unnamed protein product [Vitrella brassicaformis CCMP3155]|eukprot:CEM34895.1 unnamed protein product [Vitrella brassicaformis CCMP3155]